ncbi:hypothetical protein GCM10010869_44670 [Mesorhizobium tianshanense]|nr:hypothetical protein GCM10010869_44670 [Mesorhizobium tianshanense]
MSSCPDCKAVDDMRDNHPVERVLGVIRHDPVRWTDGVPEIDAAVAARAMKFAVEYFLRQMQRGSIKGRVERGIGEDEGRHRLSFQHHDRELTMIVGHDGEIISQELTVTAPRRKRV